MNQRVLLLFLAAAAASSAFISPASRPSRSPKLFLEKHIADMIDQELYRQNHKKDFETEWMEKNRAAVLHSLSSEESTLEDPEDRAREFRQHAKDKRLAKDDPQRYCQDRCVATGNCDVYEDFFDLSATEVKTFCESCVLGQGDTEECVIPDAFWDQAELAP